jgi:creatinine amidohydrolase
LVRSETLPADGEGMPLDRLKRLRELGTDMGIWWYADYPTHYCGDGRPATAEKGDRWLVDRSQALAKIIRAIKDDKETQRLQDEFFGKMKQH